MPPPEPPSEPPSDAPADQEPLTRLADGRLVSTEELAPLVYEDLRRLASAFFRRERPGMTLQPTALVNEAYMQLAGQQQWENRGHFMALAATAMRRVLLNAARDRKRLKRGGDWARVTLSDIDPQDTAAARVVDLLDLDAALQKLEDTNPRYVQVIELRYFAGLGLDETAEVLDVSRSLVAREWAKARAWLEEHLSES